MRILPLLTAIAVTCGVVVFSNESTSAPTDLAVETLTLSRRAPMSQLPKRSEVAVQNSWNLTSLFQNQKAWDKEYEIVKEQLKQVKAFEGKLNSASALRDCFALDDDVSLKLERLYVYANMKHHEDTAESTYQSLSDKSKKLMVEASEATSFITPEILGLSDEQLSAFVHDPELAFYKRSLEEMIRQKAAESTSTENTPCKID